MLRSDMDDVVMFSKRIEVYVFRADVGGIATLSEY